MSDGARIDFASEGCDWEVPSDEAMCLKPGAGMITDEGMRVYCAEHLAAWNKELARREERDRPKISPELQAWYLTQCRQKKIMR